VDSWLEPLAAVLDAASDPVDFFVRDDDAGWNDGRLLALLDVIGRHRLPLDLAVIPQAIGPELARSLLSRQADWEGRLGFHQHGLSHRNHEPNGRKCEFGPSRSRDAQRRDLTEGREMLEDRLPGQIQRTFTPPWNRCTQVTGELLLELGFQILSRHVSEPQVAVPGLAQAPVSVDWSYAKSDRERLSWPALGQLAAERAALGGPVGVNLHHAVMDRTEFELLDDLCRLLARHPAARCRPLLAIVS
jgi:hypothetical protein